MKYRRDIDGLRTLAVVPVVLFHLGFSGFSGGFVGVDVFFVISGFLITGLIRQHLDAGSFSLLSFYERRARRILPALVAVMVFTCLAAYPIFAPDHYLDLGQSIFATSLFGSNVLFWREGGYFDTSVLVKPLLHTWSLAIEEQFYFILPLLMMATAAVRRQQRMFILILSAVSLVLSIVMIEVSRTSVFYLLPFRFWELGLGAMLALFAPKPIANPAAALGVSLVGVAMIVVPVLAYDHSTVFPGLAAVPPCLGAALLIWSGSGAGPNIVRSALSSPPMVGIGVLSYSIYLWHWPLIVIYQYWLIRAFEPMDYLVLIVATMLISWLSWKYIEQPFRHSRDRRSPLGRGVILGFTGASIALGVAVGLMIHVSRGLPDRFGPAAAPLSAMLNIESRSYCDAPQRSERRGDLICSLGESATASTLVWGDSHMLALLPALIASADESGRALEIRSRPGCPPVSGVERTDRMRYGCDVFGARVIGEIIESTEIDTVFIVARWPAYFEQTRYGPTERHPVGLKLKPSSSADMTIPDLLEGRLLETVRQVQAAGKKVYLMLPIPEFAYDIPAVFLRYQAGSEAYLAMPVADYKKRARRALLALERVAEQTDAQILSPVKILCPGGTCWAVDGSDVLYRDNDHLSEVGALRLRPILDVLFRDVSNEG